MAENPAILLAASSNDWDLVRALSESGCDVDATGDDWQKTALYYAAEAGRADVVKLLLDKGANGNVKPFGHSYFTVLHRAAEQGHEDVVRLLLERAGTADLDNGGETPLTLAARGGHTAVLAALLEARARTSVTETQKGRTALHLAAVEGHARAVRLLLEAGCDIDATDFDAGNTPLMLAAETGRDEVVDVLLEGGCDVMLGTHYRRHTGTYLDFNNHKDAGHTTIHADDGATALHLAAQRGWMNVVEKLLAAEPRLLQRRTRQGYTVLHYAAIGGGYDVIKMLLEKHRDSLDLEAVSADGRTALHDAAYSYPYDEVKARSATSKEECIRLLVRAGCQVNAATREGFTPLHAVADSDSWGEDNLKIVRFLLDEGADPSARTADGRSALCFSPYLLDMHQLLIDRGCKVTARDIRAAADLASLDHFKLLHSRLEPSEWDPSAVDEEGSTLLHLTAAGCAADLLELLLDLGCDAAARRRDGKTALHCAATYMLPDTLNLLVDRGCDINAKDNDGWTAMLHVMRERHGDPGFLRMAQHFLEKGWDVNGRANDGSTALHMVMKMSLYEPVSEVVQLLLDAGADATAQRDDGRTALQLVHEARASTELVEMLVGAGCDPTATAKDGRSLLHDCCTDSDMTALLLDKGCDANARDQDGVTPLHRAAENSYNSLSLEKLIEAGSDVTAAAADGSTPLHMAARGHNVDSDENVRLLLDSGAEVQARDAAGRTALHVAADQGQYHQAQVQVQKMQTLIAAGADVNASTQEGWTPLHMAARCGALDEARLLLSKGASCSARDARGATALHLAADCRVSRGMARDGRKRDLVRLLVQHGCSVDSRTDDGDTALHLAAGGGTLQAARLLVEAGADVGALSLADRADAPADDGAVDRGVVSDTVVRLVMRELIDSGCDVNARAADGKTALERVASKGSTEELHRLLGNLLE